MKSYATILSLHDFGAQSAVIVRDSNLWAFAVPMLRRTPAALVAHSICAPKHRVVIFDVFLTVNLDFVTRIADKNVWIIGINATGANFGIHHW